MEILFGVLIYLMIGVSIQLILRVRDKLKGISDSDGAEALADLVVAINGCNSGDTDRAKALAGANWSLNSIPGVLLNTLLWPLNLLIIAICWILVAFFD